jgi:hypothetical protein
MLCQASSNAIDTGCLVMQIAGQFSGFDITTNREIGLIVKSCPRMLVGPNIHKYNSRHCWLASHSDSKYRNL